MSRSAEPRIWEEDGSLSRTRSAVARLRAGLQRELGESIAMLIMRRQEWSKGGGLHFGGRWRATGAPVLIKVGIGPSELYWTRQLAQACPDLVPTLFAAGDRLGDLTLNWTVLEQVRFGPLGPLWLGEEFAMTLEAGVRFQQVARSIPTTHCPTVDAEAVRAWLALGPNPDLHEHARKVAARLEKDYAWVVAVCGLDTCHHDLHLANVVTRTPPPARSRGLLIDVAAVTQPWPFDAAYLQALNFWDSLRPGWHDLIPKMAALRREYGLEAPPERDLAQLSEIVLTWFALRMGR